MSNILERLRRHQAEAAAREATGNNNYAGAMYTGMLPPDHTILKETGQEDWATRMSEIKMTIPELPQEFRDLPELTNELASHSQHDFPDDAWRGKVALVLSRLTAQDTVRLGRELIGSLSCGVSQRHVGSIFLLSYQLRKPGIGAVQHLLAAEDELAQPSDVQLTILDGEVVEALGAITRPAEVGDLESVAQGYAFLAASMLKMFTRSAENYEKSWMHINSGYKKFYSKPIPITGVTPLLGVIKQIHFHFSISELMRASLYRFLYNVNRTGEINSLQKYLYDIHLSHTGMHIFPIANKICVTMNCTPADLLTVVYARRFLPQIRGLTAAFELMRNKDESHNRLLWKYGRIFDSNFFAALQTRACPKFAYILACVLQRESPEAHAGILGIRQFEEVGLEDRAKLKEGSKLINKALHHVRLGGTCVGGVKLALDATI